MIDETFGSFFRFKKHSQISQQLKADFSCLLLSNSSYFEEKTEYLLRTVHLVTATYFLSTYIVDSHNNSDRHYDKLCLPLVLCNCAPNQYFLHVGNVNMTHNLSESKRGKREKPLTNVSTIEKQTFLRHLIYNTPYVYVYLLISELSNTYKINKIGKRNLPENMVLECLENP